MSNSQQSFQFSIGKIASLACLLEVCAAKPGNVHRGADFEDLSFTDFVVSAEILGQAIDSRESNSIGQLIHNTVSATAALVSTNTNLGIALLLGPLAIAAEKESLSQTTIRRSLKELTADDSRLIYEAVRIAKPGGLGRSEKMDVRDDPPASIVDAMQYSSDQDLIARQYSNDFQQVFDDVLPLLLAGQSHFNSLTQAIVYAHVSMLARYGDSLIERKLGKPESEKAQMLARKALETLADNSSEEYQASIAELDFWMRSDGHRRNPGTTADLIVAGLFTGMVNEQISAPFN